MTIPVPGVMQRSFERMLGGLSAIVLIHTIITYGFLIRMPAVPVVAWIQRAMVAGYAVWTVFRLIDSGWRSRARWFDCVAALIAALLPLPAGAGLASFRIVEFYLAPPAGKLASRLLIGNIRLNPARVLLLSFLVVLLIGTVLLMLPAAAVDGQGTPLIDALFTATSATCVTGLIVRDTGVYFSRFGQLVILMLIQTGGLGIMTFSTVFAMILGKRIGLKQQEQMRGMMDTRSPAELYGLVIRIVQITVLLELAGAAILFFRFIGNESPGNALYHAVFHAVSAFCNAGFSLYTDSLMGFDGDLAVNLVIMLLIVTGGLGFIVLADLMKQSSHGNPFTIRWQFLTVHTRMVLVTTAILLFIGAISVFFFEFDNTMLPLSTGEKLMASMFQSVTFRTAGFNTLNISECRTVTLFIAIILMFIGASPSSTGGGIKTTTFAVLVLSIKSLFQSRDKVELYHRTIPARTVLKSIAILLFFLSFLTVFCVLLLATQTAGRFIDILFEATSAIGTVGLSTGMTTALDPVGKLLVTLLMYVGRVGPLTVALAVTEPRKVNIAYPETRVSVG